MKTSRLQWFVLATVIVGTFLGRLDQTVVNLAIPKIIEDFGITVSAASWIATAYIIANAVFVPIWGKLGDTLGRKKIYILGFSIFIGGSVLAEDFPWNLPSMILFRIIQAVGGFGRLPDGHGHPGHHIHRHANSGRRRSAYGRPRSPQPRSSGHSSADCS